MSRSAILLPVVCAAACQTYEPVDLDLAAHAAAFATRHEAITTAAGGAFDLTDGISREEGRSLTRLFHPACRRAWAQLAVATADAEHAGTPEDPALSFDVMRILESVPHRWLVGGGLQFALPLAGRLGKEEEVARLRQLAARVAATSRVQEAVLELDRAWVSWSAATARVAEAEAMLERVEGLERIAGRLLAAGELTRPEARVFTLERVTRTDELTAAKTDAVLAEMAVLQALGLHPEAPVTLLPDPDLAILARPERTLDGFLASPAAAGAACELQISDAEFALELRRQWPDLHLGPRWEEEDAQPRVGLGFELPLPLWNRNARAIAVAAAEREARAEAVRCAFEQWLHAVAARERRYDVACERRQRLERDLLPLAEEQLADSRALAERGKLDPLLLLDSLARAHDARVALIGARHEQALRAADLTALRYFTDDGHLGFSR